MTNDTDPLNAVMFLKVTQDHNKKCYVETVYYQKVLMQQ